MSGAFPIVPGGVGATLLRPASEDVNVSSTRHRLTEHANQTTGSYELALAVVVFGLFGWWLDTRFDSTPWLILAFTVLGFIGAGLSLYYRYRAQIARIQQETADLRAEAVARGKSGSVAAESGQS